MVQMTPGQTIYSHGGPGGHMPGQTMQHPPGPGHINMNMYAPRNTQLYIQPQPHMSQAPPMAAPQGGPPPNHQQQPPQSQQQQQQPPQQPPQQQQQQQPSISMYHHQQPPRPVVSNTVSVSGPPPSTTPQPQASVYQHSAAPNVNSQPPPPSSQPSNTLTRRARNPIKIVDPNTKKEVDVGDKINSQTPTPAATPATEPSSTSSTPAPESSSEAKAAAPSKPSGEIKNDFAARVAALAAEGASTKEGSPSSVKEESPEIKEASPEVSLAVETSETPSREETVDDKSDNVDGPAADVSMTNSSLSVSTDMRRDDSLYEPVSPTPLPDSPSDSDNKQVAETNNVQTKPSPFEEVINKKAAAGTTSNETGNNKEDDFELIKNKKKKPSAAAKKAALNSKGEKKNDLLDVVTSFQDPKQEDTTPVNEATEALENLALNKPAEEAPVEAPADEPSSEPPKVNGVCDNEKNEESELEDGEIVDDEENQQIKLKYEYASDQWSPLNPSGKKQYGREFLICLMRDPLSMQKPTGLPEMEIVKEHPNDIKKQKNFDFFTPNFVKSQSRPGVNKRGSQGGDKRGNRVDGQKPRMVINLPSISQEVKLNKAENAWKPSVKDNKKDVDPKETEIQELRRKSLAILNKLTPQKFETLVLKFQDLPIDSPEKLSLCMELVFEKAVDEPSFSVAYAQMCGELQKKKVTDEKNVEVNFRKLLISRCQQEFERDYMTDIDRDKYTADMEAATDPDDKKRIQMEYEAMEMKARKRSLGNIRFIGELYKLGMLTARIMHECVRKLLLSNPSDEEALECLCRLLTTVGKALEKETKDKLAKGPVPGLNDMSKYFSEMNKLVDQRKTSARVRFLMQDVIDLQRNDWKKRREDAGPKTIDQIHKEAEKEQMEIKLASMVPMGPPPPRRSDRQYDRTDDRRRSQKGGTPHGGHQGGGGEEGWQSVPQKVPRFQNEKIDPNRISRMQSSKVDADSMSLGPPGGRPGSFGSWGRGSQSGKSSRQEQQPANQNRFSHLDQSEPAGHYEGRGSDGRYPRQNNDRYPGRNSRDISQDAGRASALQAAKESMNPRSQSVMGPHPTLSRENSGPGPAGRSYSMVHTSNNSYSEASLLKGDDKATKEDVEKWTKPLLDEFLNTLYFEEALKEISDKFSKNTINMFFEQVFDEVIERTSKDRYNTGKLLSQLLHKKMASEDQFLEGLKYILEFVEDLLVDIPKFWDFFAQILRDVLLEAAVNMSILKVSSEMLSDGLANTTAAGKYVASCLKEMRLSNSSDTDALWRDSGLKWTDFIKDQKILDQFILDHKLEWTIEAANSEMSLERVTGNIESLLKKDSVHSDAVIDWINGNCTDRITKSPAFIRSLTTVVVESCVNGIGGPQNQCNLDENKFKERSKILKRYLDCDGTLEVQALLALQYLMHRLEHPNKLLHNIFEKLYDDGVISDESFINWEKNNNPKESEGKGVALKSCFQFMIYIKEAESEGEDEDL